MPSEVHLNVAKEVGERYEITDNSLRAKIWSVKSLLLSIGDGFKFFDFDDTKLKRLQGAPIVFWGKFKSLKWVVLTVFCWIAVVMLVVLESGTYGEIKSQSVSFEVSQEFHYDVKTALPLRMINWLWLAELIPRVRDFQNDNWSNAGVKQHGGGRLLHQNFDAFNWFDKEFLEWFICNHTRVFYQEKEVFEAVGFGMWEEQSTFNFACRMTLFANDRIRT